MKTPARLALAAVAALSLLACGKKGPPRLPVVVSPAPPEALEAVRRDEEVLLWWRHPDARAVAEFIVSRSSADGGVVVTVANSPFIDRGVMPEVAYSYTVRAKLKTGQLSRPSVELKAEAQAVNEGPRGLSFRVLPESVSLTWEHARAGSSFNVYRKVEGGIYPPRPINLSPLNKAGMEDMQFIANTVSYIVRAVDVSPDRAVSYESPASEEVTVRPEDYVPSAPTGVTGVRVGGDIILLWQENPEGWVRGYSVYRVAEGGTEEKAGETGTPVFTDGAATKGSATYRVRAAGPVSEGPPSEAVTILPAAE